MCSSISWARDPARTITGSGQIDGTVLVPNRDVLSIVMVNGAVVSGKNITIVSGAEVAGPPCPTPPPG